MTADVKNFSARAAMRLLSLSNPRVTRRLAKPLWTLLDAVTDEHITTFLEAKPRASTIYLGTADNLYGVVLQIDIAGRINPRYEKTRSVQRVYTERNLLWDVVGVDHPLGKAEWPNVA